MLNKALIQALAYVILLAIAFIAIMWCNNLRKANKTLNVELNNLRNRYNALQQDYTAYQFAMQKKEERYAETQQKLAEINIDSPSTIADKLQHRTKKSVRNKDSSTNVPIPSTAATE